MGLVDPLVGDQVELPDGTVVPASRLKDNAEWTLEDFEPAYDAVQMAKLLLLDANGLNQVIADHRSAACCRTSRRRSTPIPAAARRTS